MENDKNKNCLQFIDNLASKHVVIYKAIDFIMIQELDATPVRF